MANNAPGKTILKVTGILYIVFGSISILRVTILPALMDFGVFRMTHVMAWSIDLHRVQSVFSIVVGIMAFIFCAKIDKAFLLRILVLSHLALLIYTTFGGLFRILSLIIHHGVLLHYMTVLFLIYLLPHIILACFSLVVPIVAWVGVEENAKVHRYLRKSGM